MKRSTSLLAACVLAVAAISPASAADISAPPQALSLTSGSAGFFGDSFGIDNNGNTFADRFTFTVGDYSFDVDAIVASISRTTTTGLDISAFNLYSAANDLVASGFPLASGALDVWQLSGDAIAPGSYYLQVDGTVVSDGAASYGGAVLLTPVPEPAMLGMLAGGLGLLGVAARRRARKLA
ncbi:FxDxF family PEP-CTERM protein [Massilia sp. S19_KUP03_FR1]|uniref:FxDxF family PEP-CTERM protein n=1 Tax=Massilia sp. S19_KUP03_FR1 TaxID=3025503 RepID=UPI002FCDC781